MFKFTTYLSSTHDPVPDLAGSGVSLMPTIYDASRNVLGSPYRPRLHFKTERGNADPPLFDGAACEEMGAYLKANGITECVLDWEPPQATIADKMNCALTVLRLSSFGLKVSLIDISAAEPAQADWIAAFSADLHPVYYPYTLDASAWVSVQRDRLGRLRQRFPGRRIIPWLCPIHSADGEGLGRIPKGQFVGETHWRAYLKMCGDYADGVVVWPGMDPKTGNWLKTWNESEPWWQILLEFARKKQAEAA